HCINTCFSVNRMFFQRKENRKHRICFFISRKDMFFAWYNFFGDYILIFFKYKWKIRWKQDFIYISMFTIRQYSSFHRSSVSISFVLLLGFPIHSNLASPSDLHQYEERLLSLYLLYTSPEILIFLPLPHIIVLLVIGFLIFSLEIAFVLSNNKSDFSKVLSYVLEFVFENCLQCIQSHASHIY